LSAASTKQEAGGGLFMAEAVCGFSPLLQQYNFEVYIF
jgi:hypothetical protein